MVYTTTARGYFVLSVLQVFPFVFQCLFDPSSFSYFLTPHAVSLLNDFTKTLVVANVCYQLFVNYFSLLCSIVVIFFLFIYQSGI
jgi:hypothetical protein